MKDINEMDTQKLIDKMDKAINQKIQRMAKEIKGVIVDVTPVDSGDLKEDISKRNITYTKENGKITGFKIKTNDTNLKYGRSIMIMGRRQVNGKWYGSEQLPDGIIPVIKNHFKTKKINFSIGSF